MTSQRPSTQESHDDPDQWSSGYEAARGSRAAEPRSWATDRQDGSVAQLIHLNGPPGIGKSTLARRYAEEHPGVLDCDVDVLRTLIGGWRADFNRAGELIRPAALAMISAHLANGYDVVFPQMLADPGEVARFEASATDVGAQFVEVMLMDTPTASLKRFHRRSGADPWHDHVRAIVAELGGDDLLLRTHERLQALSDQRRAIRVISSTDGDEDHTYQALLDALAATA